MLFNSLTFLVFVAWVLAVQLRAMLRAMMRVHDVQALLVRHPGTGLLLTGEDRGFARAATLDMLLQRAGEKGIHYADHPGLQGYDIPEWSHLSASEALRHTAALHGVAWRGGASGPAVRTPGDASNASGGAPALTKGTTSG